MPNVTLSIGQGTGHLWYVEVLATSDGDKTCISRSYLIRTFDAVLVRLEEKPLLVLPQRGRFLSTFHLSFHLLSGGGDYRGGGT